MKKTRMKWLRDLLIAVSLLSITTLVGFVFRDLHLMETNVIVLYILSVILTARYTSGYAYGIAATILSFLLYNWFFTEPFYSLKIKDPMMILTVIIMTFTAMITSALTSKVKKTATDARAREAESNALYQMTNQLTDAESGDAIGSIAVRTVSEILSCDAAFICTDEEGRLCPGYIQQKGPDAQIHRRLEDPTDFQKRMEQMDRPYAEGQEFCDYPLRGRTAMLAVLRIPALYSEQMSERQERLVHAVMESTTLALDRLYSLREQAKSREETMQQRCRGDLLRAISHDLRTPLAGIMGNSEILMDMGRPEEPGYALVKDIYEDADWLHGLVENILNLTKFQDGHLALDKEPEAVEEVIGAALAVISKRAPDREIEVDVPDLLLMVPMDARLITQVLVNLLDNAVKHTAPEDEIRISVTEAPEEHAVAFTVSDRGCGIPEAALDKVFQMFYTTSKKEPSSKKGVGLGLSICRSIVEAHAGRIAAKARPGGGAEFTFTLPLGDDDHEHAN